MSDIHLADRDDEPDTENIIANCGLVFAFKPINRKQVLRGKVCVVCVQGHLHQRKPLVYMVRR